MSKTIQVTVEDCIIDNPDKGDIKRIGEGILDAMRAVGEETKGISFSRVGLEDYKKRR